MTTHTIDKSLLHDVIDSLPPHELETVYKMFQAFIADYQDRHLTPEELAAHKKALEENEWYD